VFMNFDGFCNDIYGFSLLNFDECNDNYGVCIIDKYSYVVCMVLCFAFTYVQL
jgi:hypothetical protein